MGVIQDDLAALMRESRSTPEALLARAGRKLDDLGGALRDMIADVLEETASSTRNRRHVDAAMIEVKDVLREHRSVAAAYRALTNRPRLRGEANDELLEARLDAVLTTACTERAEDAGELALREVLLRVDRYVVAVSAALGRATPIDERLARAAPPERGSSVSDIPTNVVADCNGATT